MSDRRPDPSEQAAALLNAGFSEAFFAGGGPFMPALQMASCLKCGAAVALTPLVEGQTHPLVRHAMWHEENDPDN